MGILGLILFLLLFLWATITPSRMDKAIKEAISCHEPTPILRLLDSRPSEFYGRFYQQVMQRLWPNNSDLAAMLTVYVVRTKPDVSQGHKWVRAIQQENQQVAKRYFSDEFMAEHYNPNLQPNGG